jgi:hypothetical protein
LTHPVADFPTVDCYSKLFDNSDDGFAKAERSGSGRATSPPGRSAWSQPAPRTRRKRSQPAPSRGLPVGRTGSFPEKRSQPGRSRPRNWRNEASIIRREAIVRAVRVPPEDHELGDATTIRLMRIFHTFTNDGLGWMIWPARVLPSDHEDAHGSDRRADTRPAARSELRGCNGPRPGVSDSWSPGYSRFGAPASMRPEAVGWVEPQRGADPPYDDPRHTPISMRYRGENPDRMLSRTARGRACRRRRP